MLFTRLSSLPTIPWYPSLDRNHSVADQSKSLSACMCHILEPLLDSLPKQLDSNESGVSDSTPPVLFECSINHTIQLAVKLHLADRRCSWKFFQPGSNFDPQMMKPVGRTSVDITSSGTRHRAGQAPRAGVETVRLRIFPALYMSRTVGSQTSLDANGRTFMSDSDNLRDYELIAEGLVLIQ